MFYRLKKKFFHWQLIRNFSPVLKATPLVSQPQAPLALVTLLNHNDLLIYLLALNSAFKHLQPCQIHVINDGSLTDEDLSKLRTQVKNITLAHIKDVPNTNCPKGACWERLLYISDLVHKVSVLQLDSDILVNLPIPEIKQAFLDNFSFCITGQQNSTLLPVTEHVSLAATFQGQQVQTLAEQALGKLRNSENLFYGRGCAAFAGFSLNSFSRKDVEDFSQQMTEHLGLAKWSEWGSEQVASNFIISNTKNRFLLPNPRYANYWPDQPVDYEKSAVIHFIGTNRFKKGLYFKLGKKVINAF